MSDSPSEEELEDAPAADAADNAAAESEAGDDSTAPAAADATVELAERLAGLVGADSWTADFGLAKLKVTPERWVEAVVAARDKAGLGFLSFLSAIDWTNEVTVGEPPAETVEERYEVIVSLSSVRSSDSVVISTDISKDQPRLASIAPEFGGAEWHEREAMEMFGIEFVGNPNPVNLYLPDAFEGHPLRKSYRLLSREVKPWPGMVDVEDMPTVENVEAGETTGVEALDAAATADDEPDGENAAEGGDS